MAMKAEEIRRMEITAEKNWDCPLGIAEQISIACALLREIAAQTAEMNDKGRCGRGKSLLSG